jgi:hypothetical protein
VRLGEIEILNSLAILERRASNFGECCRKRNRCCSCATVEYVIVKGSNSFANVDCLDVFCPIINYPWGTSAFPACRIAAGIVRIGFSASGKR